MDSLLKKRARRACRGDSKSFGKIAAVCAMLVLVAAALLPKNDGFLHFYALDVGQGDAIFIETPDNKNILIDGGPDNAVIKELDEVLPFYDRAIDVLILTHPDRDHLTGLLDIVKRYEVKRALVTGIAKKDPQYDAFLRLFAERGIATEFIDSESDRRLGPDVFLDILFPFETKLAAASDALNETSIVMRLDYKNTSALLTGDIGAITEEAILAAYENDPAALAAALLKVAHHGSKFSSGEAFLEAVSPQLAVISAGKDNRFGHPAAQTLQRLRERNTEIFRTDIDGRIEFVSDGVAWRSARR